MKIQVVRYQLRVNHFAVDKVQVKSLGFYTIREAKRVAQLSGSGRAMIMRAVLSFVLRHGGLSPGRDHPDGRGDVGRGRGVAVEMPLGLSISFASFFLWGRVGEGSLSMTAGLCAARGDRRWRMEPYRVQLVKQN